MLEAIMCLSLAAMGFYFFKSTDLPKDMKDRSAQMRNESTQTVSTKTKKFSLPKSVSVIDETQALKLAQLNQHKKELEMKQRAQIIDELTLKITALEQEIKVNNSRNAEIQAEIDAHMATLKILTNKSVA